MSVSKCDKSEAIRKKAARQITGVMSDRGPSKDMIIGANGEPAGDTDPRRVSYHGVSQFPLMTTSCALDVVGMYHTTSKRRAISNDVGNV